MNAHVIDVFDEVVFALFKTRNLFPSGVLFEKSNRVSSALHSDPNKPSAKATTGCGVPVRQIAPRMGELGLCFGAAFGVVRPPVHFQSLDGKE